MLSTQWFVKMEPLAEPAIEAVEQGKTKFVPERWTKTYFHWMTQHPRLVHLAAAVVGPPHPGVVLRQVQRDHGRARRRPAACGKCGAAELTQDEDVLDTWFSSWLWPFSTLGWPDETPRAEDVLSDDAARDRATTSSSSGSPA